MSYRARTPLGVLIILAVVGACAPLGTGTGLPVPSGSASAAVATAAPPPPQPVFATIDPPGATLANAYDITDAGDIVGRFISALDKQTHGFRRSPDGTFTTIDVPGAVFTVTTAIASNGDVGGQYRLPSDPASVRHGFVRTGTTITTIDGPAATFTNVLGLDGRGSVTGRYCATVPCVLGGGGFHGFVRTGGVLSPIDVPGAIETHAWKTSVAGQIVGAYKAADGRFHPYLWKGGVFTVISLPDAVVTDIAPENGGVSPRGDIVGQYCSADPCKAENGTQHGYWRSPDGEFVTIDFPGATSTFVIGINAKCDLVGLYTDASGATHAFLRTTAPNVAAPPRCGA